MPPLTKYGTVGNREGCSRYKWSDEGFRKESLFREAEKGQYRNGKESKITMMYV